MADDDCLAMEEHEAQALETLRNLTLQLMLVAAGVFGIVGGFISSSEKAFSSPVWLMFALGSFALSGLLGYVVHGAIIGMLNNKNFTPKDKLVQGCTLGQILTFIVGSVCFMVFVFSNITPAKAEESLEEALSNPYLVAVNQVLNDWNEGKLRIKVGEILPKSEAAVERRAKDPKYDFEKEPQYVNRMKEQFSELGPGEIVMKVPVSKGARLILLGAVLDHADILLKYLKSPNDFFATYKMETMLTLGYSQKLAVDENRDAIDSRALFTTFSKFRSVPYPFCCWDFER